MRQLFIFFVTVAIVFSCAKDKSSQKDIDSTSKDTIVTPVKVEKENQDVVEEEERSRDSRKAWARNYQGKEQGERYAAPCILVAAAVEVKINFWIRSSITTQGEEGEEGEGITDEPVDDIQALINSQQSEVSIINEVFAEEFKYDYNLWQEFGKAFGDQVSTIDQLGWHRPVSSGFGWHVLHITEIESPEPIKFETIISRISEDFKQQALRDYNAKVYESLKEEYSVDYRLNKWKTIELWAK